MEVELDREELPIVWNDIQKAKEALMMIKEHHEALKKFKKLSRVEEENFIKYLKENKSWFYDDSDYSDMWESSMNLFLDNDEKQVVSTFWQDFFGDFISAKIVLVENNTSFEV